MAIKAVMIYPKSAAATAELDVTDYLVRINTTSTAETINIVQGGFGSGFARKFSIVVDNNSGIFSLGGGYLFTLDRVELKYYTDFDSGVISVEGVCINLKENFKHQTVTMMFEDASSKHKNVIVPLALGDNWETTINKCLITLERATTARAIMFAGTSAVMRANLVAVLAALAVSGRAFIDADYDLNENSIGDVVKRSGEIGIFISADFRNIVVLGVVLHTPPQHTRSKRIIDDALTKGPNDILMLDIKTTNVIRNRRWNYLYKTARSVTTVYNTLSVLAGLTQSATINNDTFLNVYSQQYGIIKKKVGDWFNTAFADLLLLCGLVNRRIYKVEVESADLKLGDVVSIEIGTGKFSGAAPASDEQWANFCLHNNSVSVRGNYVVYEIKYDIERESMFLGLLQI